MEPDKGTQDTVRPADDARYIDRRNLDLEAIKKYLDFLKKGRKPLKFFLKFDIVPYLDDLYQAFENAKDVEIEHYERFIKNPESVPGYVLLALGLALILESIEIHGGKN